MAGLWIKLVEQGVNSANNTSTVAAYVYLTGNGQSWNNDPCPGTLTLDGTTYSFSHSFTTSTSDQLLYSVSKTVTHDSNGSKTVNASATFNTDTSAFGNLNASKSLILTNITTTTDLGQIRIRLSQYDYGYDGTAKTPTVTISGLTEGTHFTVAYSNNIDVGMGIVTVTGKGSYTGSKKAAFNIIPNRKIKTSDDIKIGAIYYRTKPICSIHLN